MSQTPHPHDPYGTEPGTPAPGQPEQEAPTAAGEQPAADAAPATGTPAADSGDPFGLETGSPTSDPALHPHDPYAYDPSGTRAPSAASASEGQGVPASDPYAPAPQGGQAPYAAPAPSAPVGGQPGYGGQNAQPGYGGQGAAGAPGQTVSLLAGPPAGTKGVYEGPLSGQPTSDSDAKLWAMLSQLSVILGHLVSYGFLGWVGPLVIFLIYKDRSRFVRFHAAEALNGAISVVIAQVVLAIVLSIFGVITLGFGFALFPLVGLPALVQLIFSIVAAVKANQGEYWNYPLNIRLVK